MDRENIRLECLKLAHRFDRTPAQVVDHAKAYEEYVTGEEPKKGEVKKPPQKKSGNPDFMS